MEEEMKRGVFPHVLLFPFPAQGHINQMLKLAELLCLAGLRVTVLNTDHNHHRLHRFTDVQSRFSRFTGRFHLESITDGAPADDPRPSGFLLDMSKLLNMKTAMTPSLRQLLISSGVTCIITDGIMTFAIDVGKELGIPTISFRTISAACLWTYFCLPDLIQSGEIPFPNGADMDQMMSGVPGMETFFRRRDLPSFFRSKDFNESTVDHLVNETLNSTRASAHILNTFEDLEGPILSQIRTKFQKVYTIGPLHSLLNLRRGERYSSNGLWEEDRSCLTWLDSQPSKSVLYVSFGSITVLTPTELLEFWHGLVNSGKRFLWVRRQGSVAGEEDDSEILAELREGAKERGFIVKWAPQEEVLTHPSVGGFLTHSGWNSTLESMAGGVPMISWPHMGDQMVNSRFVGEVWKIGLDMKDICERKAIEKMVRDVMDSGDRREELRASTAKVADMARKSVSEGGSSCCNFEALVQELKLAR